MDYYKCIKDFTIAFDCFYREQYDVNDVRNHTDISKLRFDLIKEELTELNDAYNNKDFIEFIDALTDIIYVTYGAAVTFGIDLNKEFRKYIKYNGSAVDISHFQMINRYRPLNIKKNIFENKELSSDLSFQMNMCFLVLESLRIAFIDNKDLDSLPEFICDINYKIFNICILLGIDLDKSFDIVHKSNMSKLCDSEEVAIKTVENYRENDDRYDSPIYMPSALNTHFIVKNESTGKVLKSINYTPANFQSMLEV
tara:strand:+ start:270 stop:1031 length:762 start_codon:yes stop_codon:yes gene_type:complete